MVTDGYWDYHDVYCKEPDGTCYHVDLSPLLTGSNCYGANEIPTEWIYVPDSYAGKPCWVYEGYGYGDLRTHGNWDVFNRGCAVCDGKTVTKVDQGDEVLDFSSTPYCSDACGAPTECRGVNPGGLSDYCSFDNPNMRDACDDNCNLMDAFCDPSCPCYEGDFSCEGKKENEFCGFIDGYAAYCNRNCICQPLTQCSNDNDCDQANGYKCCAGDCIKPPADGWYKDTRNDFPYVQCSGYDYAYVSAYQYRDYTCAPAVLDCDVTEDTVITQVDIPGEPYADCCAAADFCNAPGRFGSDCDDPLYYPPCDIDDNCFIDGEDITSIAWNCGNIDFCKHFYDLSVETWVEHPAIPRNVIKKTNFAMTGDYVYFIASVWNITPTRIRIKEGSCYGREYCSCEPKTGRIEVPGIGVINTIKPTCYCTIRAPLPLVEHPEYYKGGVRQTFNFYVCADYVIGEVPVSITVHSKYAPLGITEIIRNFFAKLFGG